MSMRGMSVLGSSLISVGSQVRFFIPTPTRKYFMPISHEALFKVALNLEDPWYITSMDFSVEGRQLDIHVDFNPAANFLARNARNQAAACTIQSEELGVT